MASLPGYTGVRVLGLEQAKKNLATLSDKLQRKIIRQAVNVALGVIAKKIKSTTYTGKRQRRTGLLLMSQGLTSRQKKDEVLGRVRMRDINVAAGTKGSKFFGPVNPHAGKKNPKQRAFYWWMLEKGTKTRTTKRTRANRGAVPASPWVIPAFDATHNQAIDAFERKLSERLADECN